MTFLHINADNSKSLPKLSFAARLEALLHAFAAPRQDVDAKALLAAEARREAARAAADRLLR